MFTHHVFDTDILVSRGACLFALCPDAVDIAKQLGQLLGAIPNVYTLVLAVLVDKVELAQHFEEGEVGAGIVNDAFGAVLDEEFEQLQGLALGQRGGLAGVSRMPAL